MKIPVLALICLTGLFLTFPSQARGYGRHYGNFHTFSHRTASGSPFLRNSSPSISNEHYTRAHIRRNGVHVRGHYATNPNKTRLDNYSTRGNYNPYSGRKGSQSSY